MSDEEQRIREQRIRELQVARIGDSENIGRLLSIIASLKTGSCWCSMGIGNPMVKSHTDACKAAAEAVGHMLARDYQDRATWVNFRHAAASDPVLHRFAHLESLGALSREEAAIGAALVLADLVREMNRREFERLSLRSALREKGHQP